MPELYDSPNLSEAEHAVLDHTGVPGVQSGASVSLFATDLVTDTVPNPVAGGDMQLIVLPAEDAVLAVQLEGDDFPRILITGRDGIYLSDGSFDAYNDACLVNAGVTGAGLARLQLAGPDGVLAQGDLEVLGTGVGGPSAAGVILNAPNATKHRIKVANDGTLSTEPVV